LSSRNTAPKKSRNKKRFEHFPVDTSYPHALKSLGVNNTQDLPAIISDNPPLAPNEYRPGLTKRQSKFVDCYILLGDKVKAAIAAGYSVKSAPNEGCRLIKHATILQYIADWRKTKKREISKPDFVDMALSDYESLEKTEPNAPRFLDIAGKALGYTTSTTLSGAITNNTQINIGEIKIMPSNDKWDALRSMLEQ